MMQDGPPLRWIARPGAGLQPSLPVADSSAAQASSPNFAFHSA